MPLTQDKNWIHVDCGCGRRSPTIEQHYVHIVTDCPLLRCRHCFRVIKTDHPFSVYGDDEKTHKYPDVDWALLAAPR